MKKYTLADLPKEALLCMVEEFAKMYCGAPDKLLTQAQLREILLNDKKQRMLRLYSPLQRKEQAIIKARSRAEKNAATLAFNLVAKRVNALVHAIQELEAAPAAGGDNLPKGKGETHESTQQGTA